MKFKATFKKFLSIKKVKGAQTVSNGSAAYFICFHKTNLELLPGFRKKDSNSRALGLDDFWIGAIQPGKKIHIQNQWSDVASIRAKISHKF